MIHYHGLPLGGKAANRPDFISGRHVLIPFTYPGDLEVAKACASSFVVDNGAFTIWNRGEEKEDWSDYYEWVAKSMRHPAFDWALIPDVIDGDESENDKLIEEWPFKHIGVPVWHLHESLERAKELVMRYHRIGLGSSGEYSQPNTEAWWDRMSQLMNTICDEDGYPLAKLHGLRMLDPKVFTELPLSSADSTNAAQNGCVTAKRHNLDSTITGQVVIARRVESQQSAERWVNRQIQGKFSLA